jgi:hypothetical protein
MFLNFFKKHSESVVDFVYDQAVILDINLEGLEDFGTNEQHKELELLQAEISKVLPPKSGVDGDEFGDGTCTIYIYGTSANKIFKLIEPILKSSSFNHVNVTLQYGRAENPNTKDKKFSL